MLVLAMQFSTCGDASGPPEIHTAGITRKSVDTLLENGTEGPNDTAGARAGDAVYERHRLQPGATRTSPRSQ